MKLSEQLRYWRAERPDEWKMDEFIRLAEELEREAFTNTFNDAGARKGCTVLIPNPDRFGMVVIEDRFGEYHIKSSHEVFIK